jgi:hypothetical protein
MRAQDDQAGNAHLLRKCLRRKRLDPAQAVPFHESGVKRHPIRQKGAGIADLLDLDLVESAPRIIAMVLREDTGRGAIELDDEMILEPGQMVRKAGLQIAFPVVAEGIGNEGEADQLRPYFV